MAVTQVKLWSGSTPVKNWRMLLEQGFTVDAVTKLGIE